MKSSKLSSRKLQKQLTDRKDLSFLKTYGELHPINDQEYLRFYLFSQNNNNRDSFKMFFF